MAFKKYRAILADCPWEFRVWNRDTGSGRSAEAHYPTQGLEWIKRLPIRDYIAKDSVIFSWGVFPSYPDNISVMESWGFTYKTLAWVWIKLNKRWADKVGKVTRINDLYKLLFMGMGYYTRANPEVCLIGTMGSPGRAVSRSERNIMLAPVGKHSQKPDLQYQKIDRLFPQLTPRLELFARQKMPGWDTWGNEVEKDINFYVPDKHDITALAAYEKRKGGRHYLNYLAPGDPTVYLKDSKTGDPVAPWVGGL